MYKRQLYNVKGDVPEEYYELPLYQAEIEREGDHVTIVATQVMLNLAHKAAAELEAEGISVEIINPRTIVPYDKLTVMNSVAKTSRLVVVQEGPRVGGWAAEFSAMISEDAFEYLSAPIKRVTSVDSPVPFAPVLEDSILPTAADVARACREVMEY